MPARTRTCLSVPAVLVAIMLGNALNAQELCVPEFEMQPVFTVANNFGMNALEDYNGDGHLDLTVGLAFYLGDGTGSFGTAIRVPGLWSVAFDARSHDFDDDGILDTAMVGFSSREIALYWGKRQGNPNDFYERPVRHSTQAISSSVWHMEKADFNEDGRMDLIVISFQDAEHIVFINNGNRTFTQSRLRTRAGFSHMLTVGDFDGDSHQDIAIGRSLEVGIFFGTGTGTFGPEIRRTMTPATGSGHRFRTADFDEDGRDDLVATAGSRVNIYFGRDISRSTGIPAAATHALVMPGQTRFIEPKDVNGDGDLDVVALTETSRGSAFRLFLGSSEGEEYSFQTTPTTSTGVPGSSSVLGIGDVNEDGAPDLVITTEDTFRARFIWNAGNCLVVEETFALGDANGDLQINLSDAVALLNFLFSGNELVCPGAGDANSDGSTNLTDAVFLLNFLFQGTPGPADEQVTCDA